MRRVSLAAIGFLLVFATPTLAQDAAVVDPDHYTVEFENDQVRVIRISYGPGEMSVMHEHPAGFVVALSSSQGRFTYPDGTTEDFEFASGDAWWAEAVTHLPENLGDKSLDVILVELKSPPEEGCM